MIVSEKTPCPSKDLKEMSVDYCDCDLVKHEKLVIQIIKEDQTPVTYQYPEVSLAKIIDKEFNMKDFTNE